MRLEICDSHLRRKINVWMFVESSVSVKKNPKKRENKVFDACSMFGQRESSNSKIKTQLIMRIHSFKSNTLWKVLWNVINNLRKQEQACLQSAQLIPHNLIAFIKNVRELSCLIFLLLLITSNKYYVLVSMIPPCFHHTEISQLICRAMTGFYMLGKSTLNG